MSPLNTQKEALISRAQSFLFDSKVSFHYDLKSRKWHFTIFVWRKKKSFIHPGKRSFILFFLFQWDVKITCTLDVGFLTLNTQLESRYGCQFRSERRFWPKRKLHRIMAAFFNHGY